MKLLYSNQSFLWLCAKLQDGNQHGCLQSYVLIFFSADGCHVMTAENLGCYQPRTDWNGWANETLCSNLDFRKNNTDSWRTSALDKDLTISDQEEAGGRDSKTQQQKLSEAFTSACRCITSFQKCSGTLLSGLSSHHDLLFTLSWVLWDCGSMKSLLLFPLPHTWSNTLGFLTWCSVFVLLCEQRLEKTQSKDSE